MSTIGTNASTQACWSLVNCVINQRLLEALAHNAEDAVAAYQCDERDSGVIRYMYDAK